MKNKLGLGLIILAVLVWVIYFVMQFPNIISNEQEIKSYSSKVLIVVTLVCVFLAYFGNRLRKGAKAP